MSDGTRRGFLLGATGAGLLLTGCAARGRANPKQPEGDKDVKDVSPAEDLMREHGVLNRILLAYDECSRRLKAEPLPVEALAKAADIIRRFIEQYHEKLEEDFLFPHFESAGKLVDLVATLRRQHAAGRTLTGTILGLSTAASITKEDERRHLASALDAFTRMYRPHEAREDTVLFPALRDVMSDKELHDLGERFEDKEHELFGKEGFEGIVKQLEPIESALGIFDLAQFTPR